MIGTVTLRDPSLEDEREDEQLEGQPIEEGKAAQGGP
jgi:hypothetical protein